MPSPSEQSFRLSYEWVSTRENLTLLYWTTKVQTSLLTKKMIRIFMQSDHHLCFLLSGKYTDSTCLRTRFRYSSGPRAQWLSGRVLDLRDWGAAGSSLTIVTVLCPWPRHIYPCLVLVQPRKTPPDSRHNWKKYWLGRKESNQTNKRYSSYE